MKRIRFFSGFLLLLLAPAANAQLAVSGTGTFFVKTGTPMTVDSLNLVPSIDLNLTGVTITKSDTTLIGAGGSSIRKVYFLSAPVSYAGSVSFQYRNEELNGNHENMLWFAHYGAGANLTDSQPFLYDTVSNFIRQNFTDTFDLSMVTATDSFVVLPANGVFFDSISETHMRLRFSKGKGSGRLVVMKKGSAANKAPHDNTSYTANSELGLGSDLTLGNYIVYQGTGDSVTISGLEAGVVYYAAVYEYSTMPGLIDYATPGRKASAATRNNFITWKTAGLPYKQQFDDSLVNGKFPLGWSASQPYVQDDGSSPVAGVKSYGTTGSADRALGAIYGSGETFGAKFVNGTKKVLTSVLLKYSLEQWRKGGASTTAAPDSVIVEYSLDATSVSDNAAAWTAITMLGTSSPVTGTGAGALNGDIPASQKQVEASITGITLGLNKVIYIRFRDYDLPGGADDGLAIDHVEVVPFSTTFINGGTITATTLNDLNITGGTAVASATTLKVTNSLNIAKDAVLDFSAPSGKSLSLTGPNYGIGTISMPSGNLGMLSVGGNRLGQKLFFTPAHNTVTALTLKGGASASLGNQLNISAAPRAGKVVIGTETDTATLYSNGFLTLRSDTLATAGISEVFGSILGDVVVERTLQAKAGIRLVSNPFKDPISISQLTDNISVDVSGGAGQNIWFYDQSTANPSGISSLAASTIWTGYTSAADLWNAGPIRIQKPAGPQTLDFVGAINQGDVHMPVNSGPGNLILLGNPYPSSVQMGGVLADGISSGAILPTAIYSWNPTIGSAGAFVTIPHSKFNTTRLPICGAFVALVTPNHSGILDFFESDKTPTGDTRKYFRPGAEDCIVTDEDVASELPEGLQLIVEQDGQYQDGCYLYFDSNASTRSNMAEDAPKINNPAINLFSLSDDHKALSVDSRPFEKGKLIPLGFTQSAPGSYRITVSDMNLPSGDDIFLVDQYTGAEQLLKPESGYAFSVDAQAESTGEQRFYLRMGQAAGSDGSAFSVEVSPNPAHEQIVVSLHHTGSGLARIDVLSLTGQRLLHYEMDGARKLEIPVAQLPAGVYLVQAVVDGQMMSKKFMKQ